MKVIYTLLFACLFVVWSCELEQNTTLTNAEKSISVELGFDAAQSPFYTIKYLDKIVLDTSYLGLKTEGEDFSKNLKLTNISKTKTITDNYSMLHGKQQNIHYEAEQYVITYENKNGHTLECVLNISKNGVAFKYILPKGENIKIIAENTTYGFDKTSTKSWLQPMSRAKTGWKQTNPSYEEHYKIGVPIDTKSEIGEGYVYPALFESAETWLLISEANLHRNYCGTRLVFDDEIGQMRVTFPQEEEVFPNGELLPNGKMPFETPWRIIAIGDLKTVTESTLGTDLAAPAIEMNTDFVSSGLASWSWVLLKDDFTNYETSMKFIDYASEMNWQYCLIDADWDKKIGYKKMQELVDYAKTKNVKILLWFNSSGIWNETTYSPKGELVTAKLRKATFGKLEKMGVAGVKVDFFGGDGQSMIAYYHDMFKDAADHNLLVNCHGATLPRGWHRTYPNLMTIEAIKGQEFITFFQENADLQPSHCAVIPFTRNVFDPMDFTPMVLHKIPNIERKTTMAFELALPTLFTSGVQHIAETPEGMTNVPEFVVNYLKDIPTQWDEMKFISGYPGKEVVIARRKSKTWFISGINGEATEKSFDLDLSFAENSTGVLFEDDEQTISQKEIQNEKLKITVQAYGGFVIKI